MTMATSLHSLAGPTVAAELDVRELDAGDRAEWDAYVEAHRDGSFFHLAGWRSVLQDTIGFPVHYLVARRGVRLVGVLPLARVRSLWFGDALVSLPFCVQAGVLADDDVAAAALVTRATALAERQGVDHLELRHAERRVPDFQCKDDVYVGFKRSISRHDDENLKAIPRKQRAMVRKGIGAGLCSRRDQDLADFFNIYATSVRNLGTPVFPRRYFEALRREFGERTRVTTVIDDGEPVSSVLSFVFRDTVLPYYGGGLPRARALKAYDFLYWEVMREAASEGLAQFDFGRSKRDSGSCDFKKNWGFIPQPLHYEYHLVKSRALPNLSPNNPKYRLAIDAWKRLPLALANRLGPLVSPYLA